MSKKAVISAVSVYLMWGVFPLYFKSIQQVPPLEIIFHRVVWSFLILAAVVSLRKEWPSLRASLGVRKITLIYLASAILIGLNWLLYVWAVNSEHVVEASLGYFINPLFSVALGVLFFRERLRLFQWLPIILAALGVIYLTVEYGQLPWISLGLAFTFGLYGMVKKLAPLGSLHGLAVETGILFLPSAGILLWLAGRGEGAFSHLGWTTDLLLMGAGVVTTVPLLLFASAARGLPLWLLGMFQYIAPTLQFLIGVLVYKEGFTSAQFVGYAMIWFALAIFTTESIVQWRKAARLPAAAG